MMASNTTSQLLPHGLRLLFGAVLLLAGLSALASGTEEAPAPKPVATAKPPASGSGWHRLKPTQKQALEPLAGTWDTLNPAHQRKWLEVSKNYPSLSAGEQAKMHERMTEWAALTPLERAQARLNFGKTTEIARELTPSEKLAKWEAYQALPPEERQKLSENTKSRPLGAAPAVQPVPTRKLAVVPPVATAKAPKPAETPAAAEPSSSN